MKDSITTFLEKMPTFLAEDKTAQYAININDGKEKPFPLNSLVGKSIHLQFTQRRQCIACQIPVKKIYQQGYCFPCTQKLASCDLCIVKPERCHFHLGTCREPSWGEKHCFSPHIIYLANTSGVKVGITRETQIPNRWIDQGAMSAMPLFRVTSRYHAGLIEVALASQLQDKTDWRKMLKNDIEAVDLVSIRNAIKPENILADKISNELLSKISFHYLEDSIPTDIQYPLLENPKKIVSLNLEKTPEISGTLLGIKGQYFILDCGVLNIRNHSGYEVKLSYT